MGICSTTVIPVFAVVRVAGMSLRAGLWVHLGLWISLNVLTRHFRQDVCIFMNVNILGTKQIYYLNALMLP